jgi:DHA1 family bicyclomycin/chloramphenicol resistance-like MFS transporter
MTGPAGPAPGSYTRSWRLAAMLAALAMLGPFSIDTYLPAFPNIGADLAATPLEVQQTMSAYLFAYALMMLWHGALSDALGRRPVVLAGLACYALATLGCALAGSIEVLWLFRVLQGLCAGAGLVVGRAMIRDRFHGPEAQRLMSQVTLVFGLAPALAPIFGGMLASAFGWRSIFVALLGVTLLLLALSLAALPETLPPSHRRSLAPRSLLADYRTVLGRREFLLLAGMVTFNFSGFFLYIASAPVFLMRHLGLGSTEFAWLFVPMVIGIMLGAFTSGRVAGRLVPRQTIALGYAIMFTAVALNLAGTWLEPPGVAWRVLPIAIYTFGSSLIMPSVTLTLLDLFARNRGMVSSLQSFVQIFFSAVNAGAVAPFLAQSTHWLALGMLVATLASFSLWHIYRRSPGPSSS